jgi:hypothetical protein
MKPRPKDAKPRKRALKQRRELFQYDGCAFIGRIVVDPCGKAKAFDGARKRLGLFPNLRAAMSAISAARMSASSPTVEHERPVSISADVQEAVINGARRFGGDQ